jgi:hypothetical protein
MQVKNSLRHIMFLCGLSGSATFLVIVSKMAWFLGGGVGVGIDLTQNVSHSAFCTMDTDFLSQG